MQSEAWTKDFDYYQACTLWNMCQKNLSGQALAGGVLHSSLQLKTPALVYKDGQMGHIEAYH